MRFFSLFLSSFFLLTAGTISAQDIILGAKLGGVCSSVTDVSPRQHVAFGPLGGLSCGFSVDPRVELQAEVLYMQRGYTYAENAAHDTRIHIALHYLDIPLSARFAVTQQQDYSLSVIMGGYVGFLLKTGASPALSLPVQVTDEKNIDAGVVGGIAVDLPLAGQRISFEARCSYGLQELGYQYEYPLVPPDTPPTIIEHRLSGSTIAVTLSAAYFINVSFTNVSL